MSALDRGEPLYRLPAARGARAALGWWVALGLALSAANGGWLAGSAIAGRLGYAPRLGRPWVLRPFYPDRWCLVGFLLVGAAVVGMLAAESWRRVAALVAPLGVPLLLAGLGPLYGPLRPIAWARAYGERPALGRVIRAGELVGLAGFLASMASTVAYGAASLRRLARVGDLHGSSHWASAREAAAAGLLPSRPGGIVVGRLGRQLLVDHKDRHVLVYAPSGSGKSSCLVIPTLLRWQGSVLAFDIKGELWERTAGHRQHGRHCTLRFDPTLPEGSVSYNPLLAIPRSEEDVAAAQDVADILVNPEGKETTGGERFFEDTARALLTGVILHVVYTESNPSLGACLELLSAPQPVEVWKAMASAEHDPTGTRAFRDRASGAATKTHPTVASAARRMQGMDFRTATGVQATAQSKLVLWEDPVVCRNTLRSGFRGRDLVAGDRPVSVYLTIAPSDLDRMRPLLRIVLNQITRELTRDARSGRRPVLLMLDEFTALGRLDFMHRGIGFFRGYGVRVFISIQSLEQLFQIYGQHQSISANCGVQVAYGANDVATAKLLSEMTGRRTVEYRRWSRNGGTLFGRRSESETEAGRPLLTPDEVRRLPDGEALIYVAGCAPIRGERVPYFRDPRMAVQAGIVPPDEPDKVSDAARVPGAAP